MNVPLKPIYLFADSQLLFWKKPNGGLFLRSIRNLIEKEEPKAAYIGASNDDNPEYYAIFEAAMGSVQITDCHMIRSRFSVVDEAVLNTSDIILLAGGDVQKGWDTFVRRGMKETIVKKYYEGAVLIGVSAGAVQLGVYGWPEGKLSSEKLIHTFGFVPCIVSVHDEANDWGDLKKAVQIVGSNIRGVGIPSGGGLIYHPDSSLEAIRYSLHEFSIRDGRTGYSLLFPPAGEKDPERREM